MREALHDAVRGLFARVSLDDVPASDQGDEDRLVALSVLIAQARSPVIRNAYQRDIELIPASEAPGRLVGALGRLLTGLRLIAVEQREAWRVVRKAGLDSMPAARRQTLEMLVANREQLSTSAIATAIGLPTKSAHRVLEDLAAHDVVQRESQGQGKPDLWQIAAWALTQWRVASGSETAE